MTPTTHSHLHHHNKRRKIGVHRAREQLGIALLCTLVFGIPAQASPPKRGEMALTNWLALGPMVAPMPIFHKEKYGKYKLRQLLTSQHLQLSTLHPIEGQPHHWYLGQIMRWHRANRALKIKGSAPQLGYFATYLEVDRYLQLTLKLRSHQRLRVFLDGRPVANKYSCTPLPKKHERTKRGEAPTALKMRKKAATSRPSPRRSAATTQTSPTQTSSILGRLARLLEAQNRLIQQQSQTISRQQARLLGLKGGPSGRKKARKPGLTQATLRLTPGLHLLVVKTLYAPTCITEWKLTASLHQTRASKLPPTLRTGVVPHERHNIAFLLRRKRIRAASLSPDGRRVVLWMYARTPTGKAEHWVEQRRTSDGKLLHSSRPYRQLHQLKWSPDGRYYSFVSHHRHNQTLWLVARDTGRPRALRRGLKQLWGYTWSPNGRFLILNIGQREKPSKVEKIGAKRLRGMGDRWPWYRRHSHLYALTVPDGSLLRLTAGRWSIWGPKMRTDGKKLLFARSHSSYDARPFRTIALYELDLATLKPKKLLDKLRWLWDFSYSPKGDKLLLRGGPSLFGTLGHSPDLPKGATPNEYNTEVYLYDLKTGHKRCLTRTFKPAIQQAFWHPKDGQIYLRALDGVRIRLYKMNPDGTQITRLPTGVDLAYGVSFARNSDRIVYLGQGLKHPGRLYRMDLHKPAPKMLYAPAKRWLSRLTLAKIKDFVAHSKRGVRIEGRIYLPPGFSPKKKYPAIVYYYGGTYPTTRSFDGRYPGHLWAAHGYVVYMLQPSGAIGYGQRHASRHVNEWGRLVANEIIEATKQFLAAHPFVNPKRVGCIGASYGGFMTMSIITKTKLFAAAISHAGISNIPEYWGAGYWGFLYSAVATANRYPWSHPHFFIQNSPLFSAHKITTPLLLLHGSVDTNVPPAESFQMYTALRLLKKQVELVLIKGSNHWILQYHKRIVWTRTILAWFDRFLKKQPLWWKHLHGTRQY